MNDMTNTARKIQTDARAVIVYQDTDARGRQQLTVRNSHGKVLFECRRITALRKFLRNKRYNFYTYEELGAKTRNAIDNLRAEHDHAIRKHRQSVRPVTLGDLVWSEQ